MGLHPHCVFLNRSPNCSGLAVFIPLALVGDELGEGGDALLSPTKGWSINRLIQQMSKDTFG